MKKKILQHKLDLIGWALFFIMLGVLWLFPEGRFPEDTWLIGLGIIILLMNFIRYLYGIKLDLFFIIIAILALIFGFDEYFGMDVPFFSIIFIVIGVSIIYNLMSGKKRETYWGCWGADK